MLGLRFNVRGLSAQLENVERLKAFSTTGWLRAAPNSMELLNKVKYLLKNAPPEACSKKKSTTKPTDT